MRNNLGLPTAHQGSPLREKNTQIPGSDFLLESNLDAFGA
jgi:hypothetical protein